MRQLESRIRVARGEMEADLVIKNAKIVNVFTLQIDEGDIAIYGEYIVGIGEYKGKKEIDARRRYIIPGFIDGHVHIESSMVSVPEYAKAVVPQGTTTVIIDPHEIANVFGSEGILYMLRSSKYNPLNVYIMLPSCVPATHLESAGSVLKAVDLLPFLNDKWILGLGEMMNYPGVLNRDEEVIAKLKVAGENIIDGHAPGLMGKDLNAYLAAGIMSDHECTTLEEAQERLRLGMYLMIREGSTAKNLKDLLPAITPETNTRCFFVTDDRHPKDLLDEGHIDYLVRLAISEGLKPELAIRCASLNSAMYFGLKNVGAIAPNYIADIVILDNLINCKAEMVLKSGKVVAELGQLTAELTELPKLHLRGSVNMRWLQESDFHIYHQAETNKKCRLIGVVPEQIITKNLICEPKIENGHIIADIERDILKLAVVERHSASDNLGLALVQGFGLKSGALASSVAHDSHNVVIVGTNDLDMLTAAAHVARMQGGLAIAENGRIIDFLPLPIAGLMSDKSLYFVKEKLDHLHKTIEGLGCILPDAFMTLSFLCLPVIPSLKLTDKGLVDVEKFEIVDLIID